MNIHAHGDVLRRREEIVSIVREQTVHSQEELLQALRRRGFRVTQPTLSRDIAALGLIKTGSGYVVPGDLASVTPIAAWPDRFESTVGEFVRSAVAAQNLVVIRTVVAGAQPVASAIDAGEIDGVLGTIGGDDTIFVAMTEDGAARALERRINQLIGRSVRRAAR
ncbi:MAG TPA: ArgR family transcriptional regulator [Thermoanaerobaculia bacterium]|nr:ArgR family transcriptional regulator [Thermoanaerobaculia bacterium]